KTEILAILNKSKPIPSISFSFDEYESSFSFDDIVKELNESVVHNSSTIEARTSLIESINKYKELLLLDIKEINTMNSELYQAHLKVKEDFYSSIPEEVTKYKHVIKIPNNQITAQTLIELNLPLNVEPWRLSVFVESDKVDTIRKKIIEILNSKDIREDKNYYSSRIQSERYNIDNDIDKVIKLLEAVKSIK
ncbi:MAG: hypothetical protein K2X69_14405, partial [Silvanigrellaceae bacterium]|nr:hypothetical protein [Silvanigrellaceae bacterium]